MCSGTALLYRIPKIVIGENRTFRGPEDYMRSRGVELTVVDERRVYPVDAGVHQGATGAVERGYRGGVSSDSDNIMILRRGITGFFKCDQLGDIPEFAFREFKQNVYTTATSQGYTVSKSSKAGATPNFHTAIVECVSKTMLILGHATYPSFAFSEPFSESWLRLQFIDDDTISEEIVRLFPTVTIAFAQQLNQKLTDDD